jgi:tetratricopeptide (TPR) repeat protein
MGSLPGAPGAAPKTTDQLIQLYQSRAVKGPGQFLAYANLGAAYIQKARETGDIRYYDLAETALKRSLGLNSDPAASTRATAELARVALGRHQFREARTLAEQALGASPDPDLYAIVGDAYLEIGEYDKASAAYTRMLAMGGTPLPSQWWYLQFLRGNPSGAMQELQRIIKALRDADAPLENVARSHCQLGEMYFQVGALGQSEAAYQEALNSLPGYHQALAGLARARAAQQRYTQAVTLYEQALAVIPLPEYAVALGDVYTKMGRRQEAKRQYDLVQYIGTLNTVPHTKAIYNREVALFYADHDLKLKETLELAERELDVRWDVYSYDAFAWALYKNGKPEEARAATAEALKLGTKDARLLFHAGMIHKALGETMQARTALRQALETNPHFHLLQADVARQTLRELGSE